MPRHIAAIACTSLTIALAACGGGGEVGTPGLAPVTPSAVADPLPAAGVWAVLGAADGTKAGDYTQTFEVINYNPTPAEQTDGQTGKIMTIVPLLSTKGAAAGVTPTASITLAVDVDNTKKFVILAQTSKSTEYACVSNAYSATEITDMQAQLPGLQICEGTLTVDMAARTYKSTRLTLSDRSKASNKLALALNDRWPLRYVERIDPVTMQPIVDPVTKEPIYEPVY